MKQINSLSDTAPQRRNANKHTARGLGALEKSIQEDGWIGAITVAADGETFDGSARIEVGAAAGFEDVIVVESDGSKPVVVKRVDIATTDDPRAVRLGIAANRVAQIDLSWDAAVLAELAAETDLSQLFRDDELAEILAGIEAPDVGGAGDDFDPTPPEGPARTALGDLWQIGPHRLIVGDCTDPAVVSRLMGGERAALCVTDPPFGVRDDEWDQFDTPEKLVAFTASWMFLCSVDVWAVFFADKYLPLLFDAARQSGAPPLRRSLLWRKPPGSQFAGASLDGFWYDFELISVFGQPQFKPDGPPKMAVFEHRTVTGQEHGCEKPVALLEDVINGYSRRGALLYEPFMGTGTTLVAAHEMGRRVYGCEFVPRTADVILRRAELANLPCTRVEP